MNSDTVDSAKPTVVVEVILAGNVPHAVNAAADLCNEGPVPKPYEPAVVHDRIRRFLAARPPRK